MTGEEPKFTVEEVEEVSAPPRARVEDAPQGAETPAEKLEHVTSAVMREQLADPTEQPQTDPQGKPIPPAS